MKFFKELHSSCLRFSVGHSFPEFEYLKLNEHGLPRLVDDLIPLLQGTINERRAALYLLQVYKLALVPGDPPKVDTITEPFNREIDWLSYNTLGDAMFDLGFPELGTSGANVLKQNSNAALNELFPAKTRYHRIKHLIRESGKVFVSPKKGPNGLSLGTIIQDMIALKDTPLWKSILEFTYLTKNKILRRVMLFFSKVGWDLVEGELVENRVSRLSIKIETGGKTRLFAILDWFTQSAFKGLHQVLFSLLKSIPEDGTFDHHEISELLSTWTFVDDRDKLDFASLDLSAATDRLPSGFQYLVMKHLFNERLARLWYTIMTQRTFELPPYHGQTVEYGCGQPMGALSSWAMLAVSHHVIANISLRYDSDAVKTGLQTYGIIGDDIALLGKKSVPMYKFIMNTLLGVPINPIKGFTSETLTGTNQLEHGIDNYVIEIAKRVTINGQEITPGSPNQLSAYLDNPESLVSLINDLYDRGLIQSQDLATVEEIAGLGYKPKQAMEYALFPGLPARCFSELGNLLEVPPEFSKYIWYQNRDISPIQIKDRILEIARSRILFLINDKVNLLLKCERDISIIEEGKFFIIYSQGRVLALRTVIQQVMQQLSLEKMKVLNSYPLDLNSFETMLAGLENISDISNLMMGIPISKLVYRKYPVDRVKLVKWIKSAVSEKPQTLDLSKEYPISEGIIYDTATVIDFNKENVSEFKVNYITPEIIDISWNEDVSDKDNKQNE